LLEAEAGLQDEHGPGGSSPSGAFQRSIGGKRQQEWCTSSQGRCRRSRAPRRGRWHCLSSPTPPLRARHGLASFAARQSKGTECVCVRERERGRERERERCASGVCQVLQHPLGTGEGGRAWTRTCGGGGRHWRRTTTRSIASLVRRGDGIIAARPKGPEGPAWPLGQAAGHR